MLTMLTALAALSTPLAGQGSALTVGLAFTAGGGWQIQALDVGYGRAVHAGPIAMLSLSGRVGEFIDQGAIIGGARGFLFGTTLAARTPMTVVADLGSDSSTSRLGLDLPVEATGYVGANSPLPVGSPWGAVSWRRHSPSPRRSGRARVGWYSSPSRGRRQPSSACGRRAWSRTGSRARRR